MAENSSIRKLSLDGIDTIVTCPIQDVKGLFEQKNLGRHIYKEATDAFNEKIDKQTGVRDWRMFSNLQDYLIESRTRNVTIHIKNISFINKVNHSEAQNRMNTIFTIVAGADLHYLPHDISESENGLYLDLLADEYQKIVDKKNLDVQIKEKREAKARAKKLCQNKWFEIGQRYYQKQTDVDGNIIGSTEFECIKYIYTIGKNPVNCVVMKKLSGETSRHARQLSRLDCKLYHIKYQRNLYMFPMSKRFYKDRVIEEKKQLE